MNAPGTTEWWRLRQALHQCIDLIMDALEARKPTLLPTPPPRGTR